MQTRKERKERKKIDMQPTHEHTRKRKTRDASTGRIKRKDKTTSKNFVFNVYYQTLSLSE
jgi:hypothetical protein